MVDEPVEILAGEVLILAEKGARPRVCQNRCLVLVATSELDDVVDDKRLSVLLEEGGNVLCRQVRHGLTPVRGPYFTRVR